MDKLAQAEKANRRYAVEMIRAARLILGNVDVLHLSSEMMEPHRKATLALHHALDEHDAKTAELKS